MATGGTKAVGPDFLRKMLDFHLQGRQVVDHVFFYENFRNYMFPNVFTKLAWFLGHVLCSSLFVLKGP